MGNGRTEVGHFARRRPSIIRPLRANDAETAGHADRRVVRSVHHGNESARLDLRYGPGARLLSVTISSETTNPLSAQTIATTVATIIKATDTKSAHESPSAPAPVIFRTPAITRAEAAPYVQSGFEPISVLRLLAHDLRIGSWTMPSRAPAAVELRRGRRGDLAQCVEIDERAFGLDRSFDTHDLLAALDATDRSRLRVAVNPHGQPVAFAVTGRAGTRGYLQRLAVDPNFAGAGIGAALVDDALHWCRRRGGRRIVVNTQSDNARALALYRRLGFVDMPLDLLLLERRGH